MQLVAVSVSLALCSIKRSKITLSLFSKHHSTVHLIVLDVSRDECYFEYFNNKDRTTPKGKKLHGRKYKSVCFLMFSFLTEPFGKSQGRQYQNEKCPQMSLEELLMTLNRSLVRLH
jgi:hypothetical protein